MSYTFDQINQAAEVLKTRLASLENKTEILRAPELKALFDELKTMPDSDRAKFGEQVNLLRQDLTKQIKSFSDLKDELSAIDISAPFDVNSQKEDRPKLLTSDNGSVHPLMSELATLLDILYRMGFNAVESREIDNDYNMFTSLNFPIGHPARDDYDTFITKETDAEGNGLIAPAHTSTMQNRVLRQYRSNLDQNKPIAAVIPGRVFRNEDLDARHEHTFYQLEGIYVDKGVNTGHLIATLKTFLQTYYHKELEVKINPFYFPFTEPSFEFSLSCPFCSKKGCQTCSYAGWIELLGCGMIHPNVLGHAGIDVNTYTGFAWGGGIDRLVMMKYGIEDVRYFESGRLEFLRQF